MITPETYCGFSTDEETLVQLGFQSQDSAHSDVEQYLDEKEFMEVKKKIMKVKTKRKYEKKSPFPLFKDDETPKFDDMTEEEFNKLFKFPNEPVFCSKEIFEKMEEFLDITYEDQQKKLEELARSKRKKKRLKRGYTPRVRWNRMNKSLRITLKRAEEKQTIFLQLFEKELQKFLKKHHEQIENERNKEENLKDEKMSKKIFVKFKTSFQKYLSIGICNYYLLKTKSYGEKKVIVIEITNDSLSLPEISLFNFLCKVSLKLPKKMKKKMGNISNKEGEEKKSLNDDKKVKFKKKKKKRINILEDYKIEENEFFKIGKQKKKKRKGRKKKSKK